MQILAFLVGFLATTSLYPADYKPIILDSSYEHTKYSPTCGGYEEQFRAYTSCFDTIADDGETRRIPNFVSYHMETLDGRFARGPEGRIDKILLLAQPLQYFIRGQS